MSLTDLIGLASKITEPEMAEDLRKFGEFASKVPEALNNINEALNKILPRLERLIQLMDEVQTINLEELEEEGTGIHGKEA